MQTSTVGHYNMAPYSAEVFEALPDFHECKLRYYDKRYILDAFGQIIRAHRVEKYLGSALIHKHFSLKENERVVEEVGTKGSFLAPRLAPTDEGLTPYLWHLSTLSGVTCWVPVEFVASETVPQDVQNFANSISSQTKLLNKLAALIIASDAQDTFGLALLHRQRIEFDRNKQVLLESPGHLDRSLKVTPQNPSVMSEDDWTQTYWHFDIDANNIVNGCGGHGCAGYCSTHS